MDFKVRETIDIDIIGSEKSKHLNETIYSLLDFDYDENISIFGNQSLESVRENLSEITNIDSNLETIQEKQQNFEKTIEEGELNAMNRTKIMITTKIVQVHKKNHVYQMHIQILFKLMTMRY